MALTQTLATLSVLLLATAWSIGVVRPPTHEPAGAALVDFSRARADAIVTRLATAPRALGSAQHAVARDLLVNELTALGLQPQVQDVGASRQSGSQVTAARVQNVLARLPGSGSTGAVLITAHYDTVDLSPGAADDGAGVAALLETIRALRAGPPLRNDVIVLFSDSEEIEALGASAFALHHPWAHDARVILNFDARGSAGPVLMFETSDRNGWLIQELGRSGTHVFASSVMGDIYRGFGGNFTDLSVYRGAGLLGLNFGIIGAPEHYHQPSDTPRALDPATLQHLGTSALTLTRHLASADLRQAAPAPNAIYFNPWSSWLVWYSPVAALWLLVVSAVWLAWIVTSDLRSGVLTLRGLLAGIAASTATILLVPIVMFLARNGLSAVATARVASSPAAALLVGAGILSLALTLTLLVWRPVIQRIGPVSASVAALIPILLLCGLGLLRLAGTTYLLQWPLFAALVAHGARLWPGTPRLAAAGAIVALLLFSPLLSLLWTYFGLSLPMFLAIGLAIPIVMAFALWPLASLLGSRYVLPGVAFAAIVCLAAGAGLGQRHDGPPVRNTLAYAQNSDQRRAVWISRDRDPDAWTTQVLTAHPERGAINEFTAGDSRALLHTAAPIIDLEPPRADVLDDTTVGTRRQLHVRLVSRRAAPELILRFVSDVQRVTADDGAFDFAPRAPSAARLTLRGYAEGAAIAIRADGPIEFWLADRTPDLSAQLPTLVTPRPAGFQPRDADSVYCVRRYRF